MTIPFRKTVMVLAFSALSTLALAETPARVGRIAHSQGPVNISTEVGEEATAALVNWPVTTSNQIVTQRNGRTEIRIGSTSVRLDGDSSLDVIELDDDKLRLHLHYGSLSLRVRNADMLRGLDISTPQGMVRMKEVGRLRIDAERVRDTTNVSVFEGTAQVDGGGSSLSVRAGKRVDVHNDDVRTALAVRDSFDDWSLQRDARDERTTSDRYVTTEMTGYEELDQHGVWREDSDYGPLWTPRSVAADWVPYRDGRWTYLAPWGWTWVDNAPWGYAPSHYGRWVMVRQRWSWAPGRNIGRPVWAPALVGWVGGSNWNLSFNDNGARRNAPAQGWYPLNPGESYVPGYHLRPEHLRHHNRHARPDYRPGRHDGLTVVGLNQFVGRNPILVPRAPRPVLTPLATQNIPFGAPPRPQGNWPNRFDRDGDGKPDRNAIGRLITAPSDGQPFSRRDGRPGDNERFVRTPPQVLTTNEPQRSLAEKDRRQREAEIERRERDQANERRLRELEADNRRTADGQQRLREAELAERRRELDAAGQRGAQADRLSAIENARRQREAEAQLQGQRDALNRQQAERQQRESNNRQLAERLQRDADQDRLRQLERQQQGDQERLRQVERQQQAERQQQERQQRDADSARRQQAERGQQDAENARRQQAERQQAERQQRDAQQREAQQRDAQREVAQAQARQAQQAQQAQAQQAQQAQAQQVQAQHQKQAEEADKRERAREQREQRQDRRENVQQQIR
ncbi:DUF6600 domain-containing protein [Massilia aquatica]|uniref:FecR family protein n=1 Tax=Massilia aquatica TaxID=2609000 RepID=A0ABX0MEH9_9BURK|nr:DUF6600 domain-containing protein [Massilia aquatica]NHZ43162.1 hypothetical protein [Massilia aquatica]